MKTVSALIIIVCFLTPLKHYGEALPGNVHHSPQKSTFGMVIIPGGSYHPFLRRKGQPAAIRVRRFLLDINAITNQDFLAFVKANPQWARSKVSRLFADAGYLKQCSILWCYPYCPFLCGILSTNDQANIFGKRNSRYICR